MARVRALLIRVEKGYSLGATFLAGKSERACHGAAVRTPRHGTVQWAAPGSMGSVVWRPYFSRCTPDGASFPLRKLTMPTKSIDSYVVEFTGELLEGSEQWGAFVSILAPSDNPMHMTSIYPKKRVAAEAVLTSQNDAEAEAERAASDILKELRS